MRIHFGEVSARSSPPAPAAGGRSGRAAPKIEFIAVYMIDALFRAGYKGNAPECRNPISHTPPRLPVEL
ncbi:hypothetical protein EVAR_28854_1 [Eumeta japonica]|uniref:Uncharacterized protein n=1 Tax=Eumeta variegata TaxID=151549 RepID=A0A4C1YL98_EUMVA|nr:hypothetical protein EVAR_28854_1 [Eumeta japonica]